MEITLSINSTVVFAADVRPSYVRYHPLQALFPAMLNLLLLYTLYYIIITQFEDFHLVKRKLLQLLHLSSSIPPALT